MNHFEVPVESCHDRGRDPLAECCQSNDSTPQVVKAAHAFFQRICGGKPSDPLK